MPEIAGVLDMSFACACRQVAVVGACVASLALGQPADSAAEEDVRPIADVRALPAGVLAARPRVRVRGVVTGVLGNGRMFFLQDATAGIFVNLLITVDRGLWPDGQSPPEPVVGTALEIDGVVDPGGYSPALLPCGIRTLGPTELPAPMEIDADRFFCGAEDSRVVEVAGVVQDVVAVTRTRWRLTLESHSRTFLAEVPRSCLGEDPAELVNAIVRVAGPVAAVFNTRGEFVMPRVYVSRPDWFALVEPPAHALFDSPTLPLEGLARFLPDPIGGRMVRTEGTVVHAVAGEVLYLQENATGVRVRTRSPERFVPGDRVEVAGFIDRSGGVAGLAKALVRHLDSGPAPQPIDIEPGAVVAANVKATRDSLMASPGDYCDCLIRFPATLVESRATADGGRLILRAGRENVLATVPVEAFRDRRALEPGSELLVTGIAEIDWSLDLRAWPPHTPRQMSVLVRSAADVVLLRAPPWWTPRRLLALLGGASTVLAGTIVWIRLLRRQLAAQRKLLAAEMRSRRDAAVEFEATLRERNRLAANLHDTLLQTLGGIGYQLDACEGSRDERDAKVHFDVARRMVGHATGELHGSVWTMRSLPLGSQPFPEALRGLVARVAEGYSARTVVAVEGSFEDLPEFVAGNLLLIVQEAVHNALRHARPATVEVTASDDPAAQRIEVRVRDDGRGFSPGGQMGVEQGHFGIHGMRERAERLGGSLRIESEHGRGTTVVADVARRDYDRALEEPGVSSPSLPGAAGG